MAHAALSVMLACGPIAGARQPPIKSGAIQHASRQVNTLKSTSRVVRLSASKRPARLFSVTACATTTTESPAASGLRPAITLTENALTHLKKIRAEKQRDLVLRVGVRQGGCNGMSYTMDFDEVSNIREDDSVIEQDGFKLVSDPKSLLYLFGLQLDYSDALIGGGFAFQNPMASSSCGCGKSFSA